MMKYNHVIILHVLILMTGCVSQPKPEKDMDLFVSDLNISEDLADFTSKMVEEDTIEIIANLTMEYWVRSDTFKVMRQDNEIVLLATIAEDTSFEHENQMRIKYLEPVIIENEKYQFEDHFTSRIERIHNNGGNQWLYKIINQQDTLIFYTDGLGDKGSEVQKYFKFISKYYPNKNEFSQFNK